MRISIKEWLHSGSPWIWLNAGAVAISVLMIGGLLWLLAVNGLGYFWPHNILEADYVHNGTTERIIGQRAEQRDVPRIQLEQAGIQVPADTASLQRWLLRVGNRDQLPADFIWVLKRDLHNIRYPATLFAADRTQWGRLYGYLRGISEGDKPLLFDDSSREAHDQALWQAFQQRIARVNNLRAQILEIQRDRIGSINYQLEQLRLKRRAMELDHTANNFTLAAIDNDQAQLKTQYAILQQQLDQLNAAINRDRISVEQADGSTIELPLAHITKAYRPNAMSWSQKARLYGNNLWDFLTTSPHESNTEGGIFPAIYGTVLMVILMSLIVTPLGVVAAVYMREYARQGPMIRLVRIAVNNLAGVPSIVYGVFGLGFFVYFIGGTIDDLFFPEAKPAPTFGTGGLLWSAITLALLTVPVVIVSTEEGLNRIPRETREGSLALGATRAETLWKVVLPMASPAVMTGVILAIARAAGEVAPLMLVGVVKLAPSLPLDGDFPFLHLDRKFMHLGFHIYDLGFQSPNVEAARPLVYATALLLVLIIVLLNLSAIALRNRLREHYKTLDI